MIVKGRKFSKRVILAILILCIGLLLLSTSPKNAVKLTMAFSGHPVKAVKCDPFPIRRSRQDVNGSLYTIQYKYGYHSLDVTVSQRAVFKIDRFLIFNLAMPSVYPG